MVLKQDGSAKDYQGYGGANLGVKQSRRVFEVKEIINSSDFVWL